MTVAPYDWLMLAVLLAATARGAWKGVAWQVASLASIVASYAAAYRYCDTVAAWLPIAAPWRVFLAMLLVYVSTALGIWVVFRLVSRAIDRLKLKDFDRQIGALLGLAKGAVLCLIITLFAATLLGEKSRRAIIDSQSGHYMSVVLSRSRAVIPDEFQEVLEPYLEVFDRRRSRLPRGDSGRGSGRVWQRPRGRWRTAGGDA